MLLVLLCRKVWDVDIFWQLKLGELILARHGPVRTEPFAALHLGESLPSVAWLGQAVMAGARLLGGWGLLRLVDALCWLGGFWAVAWACGKRGAPTGAVMLALGLTFLAALPTASIRPQSFAVLCFGLLLAIQRLGLRPAVAIGIGAPLLLLWQNLHPSVSVGVAAMGMTALAGWLGWLRNRGSGAPIAPSVLALVGIAATFATPDGVSVIDISARNAEASMAIGASEWLPLWIPANHINAVPVLIVVCVTLWLAVSRRSRLDAGEVAVALLLFAMTLTAYRFVLFWAVAMVPLIVRVASEADDKVAPPALSSKALLVPLLAVAVLGPFAVPTRFEPTIPIAALERLKREGLRGTVYGDFPFGGAIIDAGYPAWRVAYDGRYYRYSSDEWKYNGGIENDYVPLVDVERKWQPVAFVLNVSHNAPIADDLAHSRRWRRIYSREDIVVYVKRKFRRPASRGSALR
jgi:hypothetical protein